MRINNFTFGGHVYYVATHAGLQGERYLLNQEFTSVKLSGDLALSPTSHLHGLFIYNTTPSPLYPQYYFDELFVLLQRSKDDNWFIKAGKQWLPFGIYKNDLIYKPTTKALGQTNEPALLAGYDAQYYWNLSLFKPRSRIRSSALPFYYNLNIGTKDQISSLNYDAGISFIYSLAESNMLQYNKGFGGFLYRSLQSHVPGAAAYANLGYKNYSAYFSGVSALQSFHANELSFQGRGAAPMALSAQGGYEFVVHRIPVKAILFYDRSIRHWRCGCRARVWVQA